MQWVPTLRNRPRQSEREAQILDGLVRGYAKKVIALVRQHRGDGQGPHEIDPTEDPGSEPHAGGWALEHGHSADEIKGRLLTAACQSGGNTRHFVRVANWLYMKSIAQICFARVAGCRLEELPLKNSHLAFFERWLIKGIV